MKKVLVIVDPQNDFITGSLAVKTASEKMDALVNHLWETEYDAIFVTLDSHPENHCSFDINGGEWPVHCISLYEGWDIPGDLERILDIRSQMENCDVHYFHKGNDPEKEEYSILDNEEDGYKFRVWLEELDVQEGVEINICGIAGDYCVLETIKGLNKLFDNIKVLQDYTASIDGGDKLREYIFKHPNIEMI